MILYILGAIAILAVVAMMMSGSGGSDDGDRIFKDAPANLKEYTMEEVEKHNKEGDLWMVMEGRVCDVSKFDEHPGGPDVLEGVAGQDATQEFIQIAHSNTAMLQAADFVIGCVPSMLPQSESKKQA